MIILKMHDKAKNRPPSVNLDTPIPIVAIELYINPINIAFLLELHIETKGVAITLPIG